MKLISVYVTVGAISFVKCEFRYDSGTPFHSVHPNQIHKGEWDMRKYENKPEIGLSENSNAKTKSEASVEELNERGKDFFQIFGQIKNIYAQCKTKVNERLRNIMKSKVTSRLLQLKAHVLSMYQCFKALSFRALDDALQDDFIPITDYAYFVRDGANVSREAAAPGAFASRPLPQGPPGPPALLRRFLATHSLRLRLDGSPIAQGRGRRRDHRMFAMMVMGFMIMASILIPMGFQFLTVLGGKSLLLAKMALIMSAINGLKKIATSNVGYGFYHAGSDGHHHDHVHHGFHEKHYRVNPQNYNALQGYN